MRQFVELTNDALPGWKFSGIRPGSKGKKPPKRGQFAWAVRLGLRSLSQSQIEDGKTEVTDLLILDPLEMHVSDRLEGG